MFELFHIFLLFYLLFSEQYAYATGPLPTCQGKANGVKGPTSNLIILLL